MIAPTTVPKDDRSDPTDRDELAVIALLCSDTLTIAEVQWWAGLWSDAAAAPAPDPFRKGEPRE